MEIQATTTVATTSTATSGTNKTEAGKSAFGELMTMIGMQPAGTDKKQATDPLAAVLAALAGGLNPLALQPLLTMTTADGQLADAPMVQVMLGTQVLTVQVEGMPFQNGELASLLKQFGASDQLLGVLQGNPSGQPALTLANQPQLLADLGTALTNLVQQLSQQPQKLNADPKVTALLENLFGQILQSTDAAEPTAPANLEQAGVNLAMTKQPMHGKLHATMITAHSLQVFTTTESQDSSLLAQLMQAQGQASATISATLFGTDSSAQVLVEEAQVDPTITTTPLSSAFTPAQQVRADRLAHLPQTVGMQADNFQTQFSELVVKRAALLEAPGRHEFRIVMQPQGLGEIEVRIQAVGNQISMQLSADSAATKGLLDSNLASLKSHLQAQGIQFDRIDVSSSNTTSNTNQNANGSLSGGLSQERQNGQSFQGQSGNQSNQKRSSEERFSLDGVGAAGAANEPQAEEPEAEQSLDVTA